jgi:hypothetical protein
MQRTEDSRRHAIVLGRKRGNGPTASLAPLQPISQLAHRVLRRLQKPLQPRHDRASALAPCHDVPQRKCFVFVVQHLTEDAVELRVDPRELFVEAADQVFVHAHRGLFQCW